MMETKDIAENDTFPRLLMHNAAVRGRRSAMREKDLGIWQCWNWAEAAIEVRHLACGLAALGFQRGMTLAIVGDNRPRLYWAMAAAQCLGGIPVPLYQDAPAADMRYVLEDAGIDFAMAENQEQVDKLFEIIRRLSAEGVSFIYISHRLSEVFAICDNVTVLRDGKRVGSRAIGEVTTDGLIAMMVGRTLADIYPKRRRAFGSPVLPLVR